MDAHRIEDLSRRHLEAFNRADWDTYLALCADDVVYSETGTGREVRGVDALGSLARGWKEAMPDVAGEPLRTVAQGDTVVLEVRWRGSQTGPLVGPAGTLPPSGRSADTLATMWSRWDGERVVEMRHHLDMLAFLTQIGALPAPEPASA